MNKKVRATLLVEVVTEFDDNYADSNDEETVRFLIEQNLKDSDFDVRKCELLDCKRGLILEQLKRVDEAELNFQMETEKLNGLIKSGYSNE